VLKAGTVGLGVAQLIAVLKHTAEGAMAKIMIKTNKVDNSAALSDNDGLLLLLPREVHALVLCSVCSCVQAKFLS